MKTLSDHPFLIGEIVLRQQRREARQAARKLALQNRIARIRRFFGLERGAFRPVVLDRNVEPVLLQHIKV